MNFDTQRSTPLFFGAGAPGLDEELNYHMTGATLAIDSRPSPAYSTRGSYLRASIERYDEAKGRPFSFVAQEYEATQLVPLLKEQFVLAAHALVTMTTADAGEAVPVMLAPFLGSGSTLRGYPTRRFTDRNRVLATAEYRWRPSRYMDMALFVDAGQVAPDRHDFRTADFDVDWGIGARFHGPTTNALRIDIARGREGVRLIFAGSQPF
jgi:outer membrane translocation and assembly module TamA